MTIKLEIEIPDWAIGKHIRLFAGKELLGELEFHREKNRIDNKIEIKEYYHPLKMKPTNGRCNGCGDCCNTGGAFTSKKIIDEIRNRLNSYEYSKKGKCPLLGQEGCIMGGSIPFSCARSNCEGWSENCTEKLIQLEVI